MSTGSLQGTSKNNSPLADSSAKSVPTTCQGSYFGESEVIRVWQHGLAEEAAHTPSSLSILEGSRALDNLQQSTVVQLTYSCPEVVAV